MLETVNPSLEAEIRHWREGIKASMDKLLEAVPDDKLDWMPAENMIPLGMIFLHMAETSDWWYDEIMKGKEATELAFLDRKCPPKAEIKKHMDEHWERLERFFGEEEDVLNNMYEKKLEKRTISKNGYWIFMHLFEHDIHHHSQIRHYVRILGIAPPRT
jgi:uncharacterized damage-inducible protein DinB